MIANIERWYFETETPMTKYTETVLMDLYHYGLAKEQEQVVFWTIDEDGEAVPKQAIEVYPLALSF